MGAVRVYGLTRPEINDVLLYLKKLRTEVLTYYVSIFNMLLYLISYNMNKILKL